MANQLSPLGATRSATRQDLCQILGALDDPKIICILELNPTIETLEEAAICVAGDQDILAKSGHHVSAIAEKIVEILTPDEEDEPPRQTA